MPSFIFSFIDFTVYSVMEIVIVDSGDAYYILVSESGPCPVVGQVLLPDVIVTVILAIEVLIFQ